jgi:trehalose 6-phosphate phosphatase
VTDSEATGAGLPDGLVAALRELARVPRLLVALDFDGTLAPEVDEPDAARALPEARDAVLALMTLPATRVALVSGRALASLEEVSQLPDEALLVGSHGIELRLDNPDDAFALDEKERVAVEVLGEVLGEVADSIEKVWLETKPAGFALHTRLASERSSRRAPRSTTSRCVRARTCSSSRSARRRRARRSRTCAPTRTPTRCCTRVTT